MRSQDNDAPNQERESGRVTMCAEIRGYSGTDDIENLGDMYRLLGLMVGADEDEIQISKRTLSGKYHPDRGGSAELMSAINTAARTIQEAIDIGGVDNPELPADSTYKNTLTPTIGDRTDVLPEDMQRSATGGLSDSSMDDGFADAASDSGVGDEDFEIIKQAVLNRLKDSATEQDLKDRYGPAADYENMAEVLATFILMGSIDLGDIEKIVGGDDRFSSQFSRGDPRFGGAGRVNSDDRFGRGSGGGDPRFN